MSGQKNKAMKMSSQCSLQNLKISSNLNDEEKWDFPGGPAVKNLHSQCRGRRFDPWSEN